MSELEQLKQAVANLEKLESEYSLSTLVSVSHLSEDSVKHFLKGLWIEADDLDILHLNLTPDQEQELYEH